MTSSTPAASPVAAKAPPAVIMPPAPPTVTKHVTVNTNRVTVAVTNLLLKWDGMELQACGSTNLVNPVWNVLARYPWPTSLVVTDINLSHHGFFCLRTVSANGEIKMLSFLTVTNL